MDSPPHLDNEMDWKLAEMQGPDGGDQWHKGCG